MSHLDEGLLLAIRDDATVPEEAHLHLEGCASCATTLEALRRRADSIEQVLTALDRPIESTAAKAGVRARVVGSGAAGTSRGWGARHLGRAAALVLLTAGIAAALPGSPLRSLLSGPLAQPSSGPRSVPSETRTDPDATTPSVPAATEIAVPLADGSIHVVLRGAAPGSEIDVRWIDEGIARVGAQPGSRFTYAAGTVEVDVSEGDVQVEFPGEADEIALEVDGEMVLSGSSSSLSVSGLLVERSNQSLRFRVDGP